jgi:hypothetical protein
LAVHLFKLIGFRNRLLVMLSWAWDYFLFERAARLILPREEGQAGDDAPIDDAARDEESL